MSPSANSSLLLGPPELHGCISADELQPPPPPSSLHPQCPSPVTSVGDDFLDMLRKGMTDSKAQDERVPMGLTENLSATYLSSGNACLDLFFHVVPDSPPHRLIQLLQAAWKQDPITTLKLVFNLRGVRGTGKTDKEGFYTAIYWMHSYHPKTLLANFKSIADFGYLKDLPEILLRILEGSEATEQMKAEKQIRKKKIKTASRRKRRNRGKKCYFARKGAAAREAKKLGTLKPKEERIADDLAKGKELSQQAALTRKKKWLEAASKGLKKYSEDPDYRALHDRVADLFARLLSQDLEALRSNKMFNISLAAKWCPSLDSSYDRSTLLCENIARTLFPPDSQPLYSEIDPQHYVYRVRERLRKEVLVPLRKALELPEVFMSANLWDQLPYGRVASVAMKNYKDIFLKHDPDRFNIYLQQVAEGKKKIAAGALLPHEIIQQAVESQTPAGTASVPELQWKRMVEDMTKLGKLSNSLAVCDVSGSMNGLPMKVCVALGLLVSEMSHDPWKGHIITFSKNPQLHLVSGESLVDKYNFTVKMDWGMNTDFQKVFDLILQTAAESGLPREKMIRQLFVFSDMEFDQASANPWETDYMVIKRKFRDAGYGDPPKIVFWNLRDSQSTPVVQEQNGVAMVSGFSKNLLKLFLENDGEINPLIVMNKAITGKPYEDLVVVD